jgi:hypothetical protein
MGWINDLLAKLSGLEPGPEPTLHPVLGRIWPSFRPKTDAWHWEILDPIRNRRGPVTATWRAGPNGPSEAQVAFWLWLCDNIDEVVFQARERIAEQLPAWTGKPVSADLWTELSWEGAALPIDGKQTSDWGVSFGTRSCPDVLLTVIYEKGRPVLVQTDD